MKSPYSMRFHVVRLPAATVALLSSRVADPCSTRRKPGHPILNRGTAAPGKTRHLAKFVHRRIPGTISWVYARLGGALDKTRNSGTSKKNGWIARWGAGIELRYADWSSRILAMRSSGCGFGNAAR